jgi:hypothetical protein
MWCYQLRALHGELLHRRANDQIVEVFTPDRQGPRLFDYPGHKFDLRSGICGL